ncbi:hypothetical protein G9P44_004688 [Scheffersomyces stipitis]|nr:hypothetical protein G9P44_004688 [Scheffersomyces stipitis]
MTDIPLQLEVSQPFPSTNHHEDHSMLYPLDDSNSNSSGLSNSSSPRLISLDPILHQSSASSSFHSASSSPNSAKDAGVVGRKRSNSQSQVIAMPKAASSSPSASSTSSPSSSSLARQRENPRKRTSVQYYVTLLPLNDTFTKKHLPVSTFPETTKLGRPTGTKHKPDVTNGYFDSRVLSRNHAQIYIDPSNGKLMLQDLGSSNGTYLNELRLTHEPVEIKMGDIVCLGFNVQAESTHKQISLKIDNISVIPNSTSGLSFNTNSKNDMSSNLFLNRSEALDTPEFKHLSFIEDIYRQMSNPETSNNTKSSSEDMTFDNALFGDINPNLEDNLLGLYSATNSGIYNNSQITNTTTLESIVNILVSSSVRIKQQNNSLISLEHFFTNYHSRLEEINSQYLESSFKKSLLTIQNDLKKEKIGHQKVKEKFKLLEDESSKKLETLQKRLKATDKEKDNLNKMIQEIKDKKEELKLEVEKEREVIRELEAQREREKQDRRQELQDLKQQISQMKAKQKETRTYIHPEHKQDTPAPVRDAHERSKEASNENILLREKEFRFSHGTLFNNSNSNAIDRSSHSPIRPVHSNSSSISNSSIHDSLSEFMMENATINGSSGREIYGNGSASSTGYSSGAGRNNVSEHSSMNELTPPISDNEEQSNKNITDLSSPQKNSEPDSNSEQEEHSIETSSEAETVFSTDEVIEESKEMSTTESRDKHETFESDAKARTQTIAIAVSALILGYFIRRVTN